MRYERKGMGTTFSVLLDHFADGELPIGFGRKLVPFRAIA
ncbi:hypothetical protein J2T15_003295 [Paenibacillus harenae]|uniref:Uncharacterized protein n=1 Tax=Paenibacillus harenae TaxID=306543 RepID=A0ABT9U2J4_PAEHA|nr:hypothetical protein [Paenibacillus harenae]MDQ0113852.1 hypothetical protein [Paenibacillus harenae]